MRLEKKRATALELSLRVQGLEELKQAIEPEPAFSFDVLKLRRCLRDQFYQFSAILPIEPNLLRGE
ncbi:hypothetical protein [Bradyrhizobium sp. STM 3557]|uniref:hypothetical protein n=1 Tax=Bradyrhizobium sp. STM 3557 TaxID=578920 RepID=UPI00388CF4DF